MFQAARILKNEFSDYASSTELFLELLKRFPRNEYELSIYFDLYEEYATLNNSDLSSKYKNLIISKYPQSKYALYLQNPKYLVELQTKNDNINRMYEQTFTLFKQKKYTEVTALCNQMIAMTPDSLLGSKIAFLKAVSEPGGNNNQLLATNLKSFGHSFPKSEPKPLADEILKLISMNAFTDYQKLVESGYLNNEIKNEEIKRTTNKNDEFGGKFSYEPDLLHYFVIAFPSNASVDLNRLRYDIANYNIDHYTKIDFDINTEDLNPQTKLVSVRSIEDKDHALIYFRSIIRKKSVFQTLNKTSYVNFIISSSNYRALLNDKNDDDYLRFFIKNYSHFTQGNFSQEGIDEAPETLMNKLSADNQPKEKGSYVIVPSATKETTPGQPIVSDVTFTLPHAFVLAIYDSTLTVNPVRSDFERFNKHQFSKLGLSIDIKKISGIRLLIIKDLPNASAAMNYFRSVVDSRNLFDHLSDGKYRNFVITKQNLNQLSSSSDVDNYISIFRDKYLKKDFSELQPAADSIKEVRSSKDTSYQGPFSYNPTDKHSLSVIFATDKLNGDDLLKTITQFNHDFYPKNHLVTSLLPLDFRTILRVRGLKNSEDALKYQQSLEKQNGIIDLLKNTDYQNFIISDENFDTFIKGKDIAAYTKFYRFYYLKPQIKP